MQKVGERPTNEMKTGFIKATVKVLWPEVENEEASFSFGVYDFEEEETMSFMARQIAYAIKLMGHEFLLRNSADWLLEPHELGSDDPIFLRPEKGRKKIVASGPKCVNNKAYCLVVEYGVNDNETAGEFNPQLFAKEIDEFLK